MRCLTHTGKCYTPTRNIIKSGCFFFLQLTTTLLLTGDTLKTMNKLNILIGKTTTGDFECVAVNNNADVVMQELEHLKQTNTKYTELYFYRKILPWVYRECVLTEPTNKKGKK